MADKGPCNLLSDPPNAKGLYNNPMMNPNFRIILHDTFGIILGCCPILESNALRVHCVLFPMILEDKGYTVPGILFIIHILSTILTTTIDPAEANVHDKLRDSNWLKVRCVFDRRCHEHVIEDLHCHICDMNVYSCSATFNVTGCDSILRLFGAPVPDPVFPTVTALIGLLSAIATLLLAHLVGFHCFIMYKGVSTYDYIIQQRTRNEQNNNNNNNDNNNNNSSNNCLEQGHFPTGRRWRPF
uniref:Protein S-acyltransferase n=1 Tax=Amphimedon queenslandica TaxID=400682 RepID=A0A1X7TAK9_AMPQE